MVPLYFSGLHRPNSCMAAASHIWPVKFGHRHGLFVVLNTNIVFILYDTFVFIKLQRCNRCTIPAACSQPSTATKAATFGRPSKAPVKRKIMEARGVKRHHLEINSRDELVKALVFFTVLNIVQLVCHNVYRILTSHPPPTVMVRLLCR
ncbi:hypothetical protein Y032_0255g329 [Ancylostoma ceylanicum]|uniref:Uncharacterized protein n=1 Tax=Ancylostoma ceylanicum TaxID=53326 RepID=A0A016SB92_9BILA|nr:hypothetical protein Y032_0255g329 [Ancylostoma ceylanicum]